MALENTGVIYVVTSATLISADPVILKAVFPAQKLFFAGVRLGSEI